MPAFCFRSHPSAVGVCSGRSGDGKAQVGDTLDVLCLGEHVERDDPGEVVGVVAAEDLEVAREGGRMAGHVEDLGGLLGADELQGGARCAATRGVEEEGCLGGIEALEHRGEEILDRSLDELAVGDAASAGVLAGGGDGLVVVFDAGEGVEGGGGLEREEPDAAVGIDEVAEAAVAESGADDVGEGGEEVEIVLEEGIAGDDPILRGQAEDDLDAAFVWGVFADLADLAADGGFGDGAFLDFDDEAAVVAQEADDEALGELVPLAADHDAVAVAEGLGGRDDGLDGGVCEAADALEEIADLLVFDGELGGVGEVLVLAAAALAEHAAPGGDTVWRGREHGEQACAGELAVHLGDFDLHPFAWSDEGDEDYEVAHAGDALAAEGDVGDVDGGGITRGEGVGLGRREGVGGGIRHWREDALRGGGGQAASGWV